MTGRKKNQIFGKYGIVLPMEAKLYHVVQSQLYPLTPILCRSKKNTKKKKGSIIQSHLFVHMCAFIGNGCYTFWN